MSNLMKGCGLKSNYFKKTDIKKEINGRERCIYKIPNDKKEYLKYKGEFITVKKLKEIIKKNVKTKTVRKKRALYGGDDDDHNTLTPYDYHILDSLYNINGDKITVKPYFNIITIKFPCSTLKELVTNILNYEDKQTFENASFELYFNALHNGKQTLFPYKKYYTKFNKDQSQIGIFSINTRSSLINEFYLEPVDFDKENPDFNVAFRGFTQAPKGFTQASSARSSFKRCELSLKLIKYW